MKGDRGAGARKNKGGRYGKAEGGGAGCGVKQGKEAVEERGTLSFVITF